MTGVGLLLKRLPARERQVATLIFTHGELSVAEVGRALPDRISSSAIRSMLRRLEAKGVLQHRQEGSRYIYLPARTEAEAGRSALRRIASEHFGGSLHDMICAARELIEAERPNGDERRSVPAGAELRSGWMSASN